MQRGGAASSGEEVVVRACCWSCCVLEVLLLLREAARERLRGREKRKGRSRISPDTAATLSGPPREAVVCLQVPFYSRLLIAAGW